MAFCSLTDGIDKSSSASSANDTSGIHNDVVTAAIEANVVWRKVDLAQEVVIDGVPQL